MSTRGIMCAALVAWSSLGSLPAQQNPSIAATLTAAKMAAARGETTKAKAILSSAISEAKVADRRQLTKELDRLQGRSGTAQLQDPKRSAVGDPIQRLIKKLDEGSDRNKEVELAIEELQELGRLVDDALLRALPQLGPFGLKNALYLLQGSEHPQLLPTLTQLLAKGDPMAASAVSSYCEDLKPATSLAVARQLATAKNTGEVRFRALVAMGVHNGNQNEMLAVARTLMAEPERREKLVKYASHYKSSTWTKILALAAEGSDSHAQAARVSLLLRQDDLDEPTALATLSGLDQDVQSSAASTLAKRHRQWVKVAAIALKHSSSNVFNELAGKVEWWREPDVAMAALTHHPERAFSYDTSRRAIEGIVQSGWQLPLDMQPAMIAACAKGNRLDLLLQSLPKNDEARAIELINGLGPTQRSAFFMTICDSDRDWHELIVQNLETCGNVEQWFTKSLDANWNGVATAHVERLVALVKKIAAMPEPAKERQRPRGIATGYRSNRWNKLVNSLRKGRGVPDLLLDPVARAGDDMCWQTLSDLAPERALKIAMEWGPGRAIRHRASITSLARQSGDHRHVDLAIEARRQRAIANDGIDRERDEELQRYLLQHASGDVRLLALGTRPQPWTPMPVRKRQSGDWFTKTAYAAAANASVRDLEAILKLLPTLHKDVTYVLCSKLRQQLAARHAPVLVKSLQAMVDSALAGEDQNSIGLLGVMGLDSACSYVMEALVSLKHEGAISIADRVLRADNARSTLLRAAAWTRLQLAGEELPALTEQLLAHKSRFVVVTALQSEALKASRQLQDLAVTNMVRFGEDLYSSDELFETLDDEGDLRVAKMLIEHERFPQLTKAACYPAIECIGDRKQASMVPLLALAQRHPSTHVRIHVADQLGRTFAKEAAPVLIDMLRDDHGDVREAANSALEQISNYLDAREKWQGRIK